MNGSLSRADLLWISRFIDNYRNIVNAYPELFTNDEIDDMEVVKQLVEEKLDEQYEDTYA